MKAPAKKSPKKSTGVEETPEEVSTDAIEASAEVVESVEETVEVTAAPAVLSDQTGLVSVVMMVDADNPCVGKWSCVDQLGIHVMKARQSYDVPLPVAHRLVDAKRAMIRNV